MPLSIGSNRKVLHDVHGPRSRHPDPDAHPGRPGAARRGHDRGRRGHRGEADRLGFDSCTGSEHVGVPDTEIGRRGAAYWDPLATFGFLAARTSTSRFVTWVLVLAYHHPLARRRADLGRRPHAPFAATCRRAGRSSSARWPRWFANATRAYRRRGPRCRRDTRPSPRGAKEGPFLRAASARRS